MTNVHPDRVIDHDIDPDSDHDIDGDIDPTDAGPNRRTWLKTAALGAAGVTAGAMAFGKTASAADDDPLLLGNSATAETNNTSSTPTTLVYDGPDITEGPSVLSVSDGLIAPDALGPAYVGGYGSDSVANGVHGSTLNPLGNGVIAASVAAGAASATDPAPDAALLVASANGSQIRFFQLPDAVSGPTAGTHVPGELYVDLDGTLWFAVPAEAGSSEVRWVKLAGTTTSGAYHAITPARSYDSRKTSYTVNGPMAPNTNRLVSLADGHDHDSGAVTTANVVPVGATAAVVNVTVSSPTEKNFIAVTAGDTMTTATSLQNWDAGVTQIANSVTVPLDASRQIRVYMGDQAGSADVIVDVFGFYL